MHVIMSSKNPRSFSNQSAFDLEFNYCSNPKACMSSETDFSWMRLFDACIATTKNGYEGLFRIMYQVMALK